MKGAIVPWTHMLNHSAKAYESMANASLQSKEWDIVLIKNKMPLRWKLFAYIALFSICMLGLLWLYQLIFTQNFFRMSRVNDLKSIARKLESSQHGADDLQQQLKKDSFEKSICILLTDLNGKQLYSAGDSTNCLVVQLSEENLTDLGTSLGKNRQGLVDITNDVVSLLKNQTDSLVQESTDAEEQTSSVSFNDSSRMVMVLKIKDNLVFMDTTAIAPQSVLDNLYAELVYTSIIFLLLTFALTAFISRGISKPLQAMNQKAQEFTRGNFDTHFDSKGYLEIIQLSDTLNYMLKEIQQAETRRQGWIADVSHDLRTPLAAIMGRCELMGDFPEENTQENLQLIYEEAKWTSNLVDNLLRISKLRTTPGNLDVVSFDLTAETKKILRRFECQYRKDGYRLEFSYQREIFVTADKIRICQVIYNFIHNAIKHIGKDRQITVRQTEANGEVVLYFHNSGDPIPPDKIQYIWNRYYQVEDADESGVGLGLSIIKNILEAHHARYGVTSAPATGCTFWFALKAEGSMAPSLDSNRLPREIREITIDSET